VRIEVEKQREGAKVAPFHVVIEHGDRNVRVRLATQASAEQLFDNARKAVEQVRSTPDRRLPQSDILPAVARTTKADAVAEAIGAGLLRRTGAHRGNSPIIEATETDGAACRRSE
jgi:hypothetical protein